MPGLAGFGHEVNQAVHLLAGGAWLGGLLPLYVLLRRARPGSEMVREGVAHFSQMGYVAVGLIAIDRSDQLLPAGRQRSGAVRDRVRPAALRSRSRST